MLPDFSLVLFSLFSRPRAGLASVWVHGCDPGRVSDCSRLALCQILSTECPSSIFFWHVCFVILVPFFICRFCFCLFVFFFCCRWSFVDVPLIFFCSADHVLLDWQPRMYIFRILLGKVEARSVDDVKKTTKTRSSEGLGAF